MALGAWPSLSGPRNSGQWPRVMGAPLPRLAVDSHANLRLANGKYATNLYAEEGLAAGDSETPAQT
ncbi:MAG: hypothetical protein NT154_05255, partial [Verrucomicrobia bacterium]|nr:hypothetical protein [Verrucomicrobiota bacterium]